MPKSTAEKAVRRNITLPPAYVARLEALKEKRGGASDSEVIRQALAVLEALTDRNAQLVLRDKVTGRETEVLMPG